MSTGSGRRRVVVVGGGVSGLAAAWLLVQSDIAGGLEVLVLEGAGRVGGKLRVGSVGGVTVDLGAESVLARRPEAVDLIAAAGLGDDLVHPAVAAASVLARGVLHPLPPGTVMGVPASRAALAGLGGLLTEDELARAGAEPSVPAPALTEDVDVASWVSGRMGRAVLDRLVEPLLGGVYAGHTDQLSLQATVPALWQRARVGGSLLADDKPDTSGGGLGAASSLSGVTQAAASGPVFAGVRGGIGRLPLALVDRLAEAGVEVRSGTTVRGLRRTPGGWRLETGPAGSPDHLDADAVILAVPPAAAARLLRAECALAEAELAGITTASIAVVAVAVPAAQLAGVTGSGLLIPPVEGTTIKAATFSSAKWSWVGAQLPAQDAGELRIVRLSIGRAGEATTLQRSDRELTALAVADLSCILRRPVRPVDSTVVRWGGALPQYAVGHLDRVRRIRAAVASAGRLAICGAALDGVGVAACVGAADRAVADLIADLDVRPAPTQGRSAPWLP